VKKKNLGTFLLFKIKDGISVSGHMINAIRYADDKAVVSNSQEGLQR